MQDFIDTYPTEPVPLECHQAEPERTTWAWSIGAVLVLAGMCGFVLFVAKMADII